jgi:hypothetical protein
MGGLALGLFCSKCAMPSRARVHWGMCPQVIPGVARIARSLALDRGCA